MCRLYDQLLKGPTKLDRMVIDVAHRKGHRVKGPWMTMI